MIYQPCFICCRPVMDQHGTLTLSSTSVHLVFHNIQHWDKTAGLFKKNFGIIVIILIEAVEGCTSLELHSSLLQEGFCHEDYARAAICCSCGSTVCFFSKRPHTEWWGCNPEWCYTSHLEEQPSPDDRELGSLGWHLKQPGWLQTS